MLRLVKNETTTAPRTLHRVVMLDLDPDLARYVEQRLHARWPALRIDRTDCTGEVAARPPDLLVCANEPCPQLRIPTLWLGGIDRSAVALQINPWLWKSPTPITGRQLLRAIDTILASKVGD